MFCDVREKYDTYLLNQTSVTAHFSSKELLLFICTAAQKRAILIKDNSENGF